MDLKQQIDKARQALHAARERLESGGCFCRSGGNGFLISLCEDVRMNLYAVHDDPTGQTENTERWWMAVWAESHKDAKLIACASYSGDGPLQDPRFKYHWQGFFQALRVELGDLEAKFAPVNPRIETRPEVLRYAGWSEGDEKRCDGCDLAPFGMKQYELCECGYCPECGCSPDCPARCNPCES